MSEREYLKRTRPTSLDTGDDPTFARDADDLGGPLPPPVPKVSRWRLRMFSEGPAGVGGRAGIIAKYATYWAFLACCSLLTSVLLRQAGTTSYGGALMWFCALLLTGTAVAGTLTQPANRTEVIATWRHYTFGLCITPATVVAGVIWALRGVMSGPAAATDTMASLLGFALPAVFITTLVVPPVVFAKYVIGYYTMNRATMTDGELMNKATRNDGLQY